MVGDRVTMEVQEVLDHHGDTIVRARYDGDYDKTNLPDELIMNNYFSVRDGCVISSNASTDLDVMDAMDDLDVATGVATHGWAVVTEGGGGECTPGCISPSTRSG